MVDLADYRIGYLEIALLYYAISFIEQIFKYGYCSISAEIRWSGSYSQMQKTYDSIRISSNLYSTCYVEGAGEDHLK